MNTIATFLGGKKFDILPKAGTLFLLQEIPEVEFLVVKVYSDNNELFYVVPCDFEGNPGFHDVALDKVTARCGYGVWVHITDLRKIGYQKIEDISAEKLAEADQKLTEMVTETYSSVVSSPFVDDTEYEIICEKAAQAAWHLERLCS